MPTVVELKKMARSRKIRGRSKMDKAELMRALGLTTVKKSRKQVKKKSRKQVKKKSRKQVKKKSIKIPKGPPATYSTVSTIDLLRKHRSCQYYIFRVYAYARN